MADRSWERGLHQMVEAKEGLEISGRQETLARISYQRFFRRYLKLAGMTGTAREVAGELWAVYRLDTVRIPTNRPQQRKIHGDLIYPTSQAKWQAIADRVAQLHTAGRPVLVGTRSVADSEHISELLDESGRRAQRAQCTTEPGRGRDRGSGGTARPCDRGHEYGRARDRHHACSRSRRGRWPLRDCLRAS